jgi:hypothetical protein
MLRIEATGVSRYPGSTDRRSSGLEVRDGSWHAIRHWTMATRRSRRGYAMPPAHEPSRWCVMLGRPASSSGGEPGPASGGGRDGWNKRPMVWKASRTVAADGVVWTPTVYYTSFHWSRLLLLRNSKSSGYYECRRCGNGRRSRPEW